MTMFMGKGCDIGPTSALSGFMGGSGTDASDATASTTTNHLLSMYVSLMNAARAFSSPSLGIGLTARFHVPRQLLDAFLFPPLRSESISSSLKADMVMPFTLCCRLR